jgi:hypothetical protein
MEDRLLLFLTYLRGWSETKSIITATIYWPLAQALMIDGGDCGAISGMNNWQVKLKCSEKTCTSADFSVHHVMT